MVLEGLQQRLTAEYGKDTIHWAYTSEILRRRTGDPGLGETLQRLVMEGWTRAAIIPLQVFPGVEYRKICAKVDRCRGLEVAVGETLMHRWHQVKDVLAAVEKDFLGPEEGINLLVLHGTRKTDDPANIPCLGLAELVRQRYDNVVVATLEGIPDYEAVFDELARWDMTARFSRIRLLPLLYVAGMHVEDDLMGEENSWKTKLERLGFRVECPTVTFNGENVYKTLACCPRVEELLLQRVERTLNLLGSATLPPFGSEPATGKG